MKPIQDSSQMSIASPPPLTTVAGKNFKTLAQDETLVYLQQFMGMLRNVQVMFLQQFITGYASHLHLSQFTQTLIDIADALYSHCERDLFLKTSGLNFAIDPTDSGWPLFIRDFHFLNNEREKVIANKEAEIISDQRLVDDAIFSLFRGVFPLDVIDTKMTKTINLKLKKLPNLEELHFLEADFVQEIKGLFYYRICVQRLEENYNIPRFYTIHIKVFNSLQDMPELMPAFKRAFKAGISTPVSLELKHIAEQIEAIDGICVEMIQRVDIGPYYSRFSMNESTIKELLEQGEPEDGIFSFKLFTIQRMKEFKVSGMVNSFKAYLSGDWFRGEFSKTLVSPTYYILPHRLIQKVHHLDLKLDTHAKMFGVNPKGELVESAE